MGQDKRVAECAQHRKYKVYSLVPSNKAKREIEIIKAGSCQDIKNRGIEHFEAEEEAIKFLCGRADQQAYICGRRSGGQLTEVLPGMRQPDIRKLRGLHQQGNGLRKRYRRVQAGDHGQNGGSHHREHSRTGLHLHKQRVRGAEGHA
eukprot:15173419-Heterocapsa_arctica.AAC.1